MKLRYIGESFGVDSLTNGKIYEATEENGMYRVVDDSEEDYLYSKIILRRLTAVASVADGRS